MPATPRSITLRVALLRPGYEHLGHKLYVQWLSHDREAGEEVLASVLASDSMYPASCPVLTLLAEDSVEIRLERRFPFDCWDRTEDWVSVLTLHAKEPGVVEVVADIPGPPRIESCVP